MTKIVAYRARHRPISTRTPHCRITCKTLARLPDEYAAVVLCDVVGFGYQEIADARVPVGTVRSRIHRGRAQLREVLV